jgi:hypothetical protein
MHIGHVRDWAWVASYLVSSGSLIVDISLRAEEAFTGEHHADGGNHVIYTRFPLALGDAAWLP